MGKQVTTEAGEPVELRPLMIADGRVDAATLRWTIEHIYGELEAAPELGRVRNALAIALMEIDRANKLRTAIISGDLGRSNYFPWTAKSR